MVSGIGLAGATYGVQQGGKVVIADVVDAALVKAEADLEGAGATVAAVKCNVTDEADCARLAAPPTCKPLLAH